MEVCGAVALTGHTELGCFDRHLVPSMVGQVMLLFAECDVILTIIGRAFRLRCGERMAL
jgi:hypothetical protein